MTDILDLKGWVVLSKTQSGDEYVIDAEYTIQPTNCPKCGVVDTPYKHGVKPTKYRDSPIRGSAVSILAHVQRYRCKHCKETFLQPLAGIHPDMRMTQRCVEYIQTQCLLDTFVRVAEHIGCDDKTVRMIADTHISAPGCSWAAHHHRRCGIPDLWGLSVKRGMHRLGLDITANTAKRMCSDKKIHDTKNDARDFAKRNVKLDGRKDQTPYKCPLCKKWHLTGLNATDSAAARARVWKKDGDK
jgi:hypothetical protein